MQSKAAEIERIIAAISTKSNRIDPAKKTFLLDRVLRLRSGLQTISESNIIEGRNGDTSV